MSILPFKHQLRPDVPVKNEPPTDGKARLKVVQKTFFQKAAEETAFRGAILSLQLNEDIHGPDGKQFGIPGGKNVNGVNNPVAQMTAGALMAAAAVLPAKVGKFKKMLDRVTRTTLIGWRRLNHTLRRPSDRCPFSW